MRKEIIVGTAAVNHPDPVKFNDIVFETVNEMQKLGGRVEVQYQVVHGHDVELDEDGFLFTAFLVARQEVN